MSDCCFPEEEREEEPCTKEFKYYWEFGKRNRN